ncbi:MAG: hypothetical protein EPO25_16410 [Gammaproteobacteria bacterium]|nr:MAG: hypothetical protein EPO25_16410 [Gammaproteobacteria bacterium]
MLNGSNDSGRGSTLRIADSCYRPNQQHAHRRQNILAIRLSTELLEQRLRTEAQVYIIMTGVRALRMKAADVGDVHTGQWLGPRAVEAQMEMRANGRYRETREHH